eukprot:TRINITY_DN11226_c0_g2_i5.p1 TRINITY_DN11226_c0_g2~~TRINITY_DN11226_c0_g2_i5.p1  ORF type:complete len:245 (+),score=49.80 TRINITY_DN11226_c0_g2_i5:642-1376(+)
MRKFQEQPAHDDPSPHVAFRPREREKRQTRYVKKNDVVSYKKLDYLRTKDLGELRSICINVVTRELYKRDMILLEAEIFDKRLNELAAVRSLGHDSKLSLYMRSSLPRSDFEPNITNYTPLPVPRRGSFIPPIRMGQGPKKDDRQIIPLPPIEIKIHTSIALLSKPIDQLVASTLELELSDDETEEEKLFFSRLESILGISSSEPSNKRRKISHTPSGSGLISKGKVTPVAARCGRIDLEIVLP